VAAETRRRGRPAKGLRAAESANGEGGKDLKIGRRAGRHRDSVAVAVQKGRPPPPPPRDDSGPQPSLPLYAPSYAAQSPAAGARRLAKKGRLAKNSPKTTTKEKKKAEEKQDDEEE